MFVLNFFYKIPLIHINKILATDFKLIKQIKPLNFQLRDSYYHPSKQLRQLIYKCKSQKNVDKILNAAKKSKIKNLYWKIETIK